MAAPTIENNGVFPGDGQQNVPLGADITILFDQGIDLRSVKDNIVVYGPESDRTSGPEGLWLSGGGPLGKDIFGSPGFGGIVDCDVAVYYVDAAGDLPASQPVLTGKQAESDGGWRHKVVISPKDLLAKDTDYTVYIIGDSEDGTSHGISSRTVYDIDYSAATGDTGSVHVHGSWTGSTPGGVTVNVKITKAGNIGTATYKYWDSTENEANAKKGKVTSRRWRRLEDGLQLRFTGSDFELGDIYTFEVQKPEILATSYTLSFSSGNGEVIELPETASASVIGTVQPVESVANVLNIVNMKPTDGSSHQINKDNKIIIEFSSALEASSVTQDNITLLSYPVSGSFDSGWGLSRTDEPKELFKKLTVDGKFLIIEL